MSVKPRRANKSNPINNKIIEPLKDDAFVAGPGQMATPLTRPIVNGVKMSNRKKRKHADSQSDYQSLDEMLVDPNVSLEMNYGTSLGPINGSNIPSTGNLVNVLVQGLQSQNEGMIGTVLDRCDSNLIRETIHSLPNEMVEELLKRLHKLFYQKGDRLIHYYNWLRTLLQEKLSVILLSKSAQQELTSLKQLFATRCDIFDRMCALRGRLSLISSLMEPTSKDGHKSGKSATINYQESSSEDEDNEDDDDDRNASDGDSEDKDLERIVVMDLSDTNNSEEDDDDDDDDDEDDDDDDDDDDGDIADEEDEDEDENKISIGKRKNISYEEEMTDGEENDEEFESA